MYSTLLYGRTVLIAAFGGIVCPLCGNIQVYTHNFLACLMCFFILNYVVLYVAVISLTFPNINDFICKEIHHQKTEIVQIVSKCKVRCMIKQTHSFFCTLLRKQDTRQTIKCKNTSMNK